MAWPRGFGWRRTSPSLVLCLIITRKICAPTCQVILLTQTAVTTMKIGFPEQGGQCDIHESQLSQDWAAREHKWGPLSTHTPIMIVPGRAHSAEGLEARLGVFSKFLQSTWLLPRDDFCCSALFHLLDCSAWTPFTTSGWLPQRSADLAVSRSGFCSCCLWHLNSLALPSAVLICWGSNLCWFTSYVGAISAFCLDQGQGASSVLLPRLWYRG